METRLTLHGKRHDTTQKQSDYMVEQSSFTLIALFWLEIGRCRGRNWPDGNQALRRISCHGRNHSQASCEYSLTIFLCCQHHSEYSLFGSKFSTNLLFAASKCHVTMQQRGSSSVQNSRTGWDRCSGETLLAPCTRKKRLQRKIAKHYYWIGVQENIGMFSKS